MNDLSCCAVTATSDIGPSPFRESISEESKEKDDIEVRVVFGTEVTQESRFLSASTSSGANCVGDESLFSGLPALGLVWLSSLLGIAIWANTMLVFNSVKVQMNVVEAGKKLLICKCAKTPANTVDMIPKSKRGAHIFQPENPKLVGFPRLAHSKDVVPMQMRHTCLKMDATHSRDAAPVSIAMCSPVTSL